MSLPTFPTALDRFQSRPPVCGTCGQTLDNHGDCWDCQDAAVVARPNHSVASLRVRYYAALFAELAADPCTSERARLTARTTRLGRMVRAAAQRKWA